jgi:hypothetical protein
LVVIALILAWWLHGAATAWSTTQSARHADAVAQLDRMEALVGETAWAGRAAEAAAMRDGLAAEIEPATTLGLAQAHAQAAAMRWAKAAGPADRLRLQVQAAADTAMPGIQAIPLFLSGEVSPREALGLLQEIESQRHLVVVEDFRYSPGPRGVLNLRVRAFYRITPEAEDSP